MVLMLVIGSDLLYTIKTITPADGYRRRMGITLS